MARSVVLNLYIKLCFLIRELFYISALNLRQIHNMVMPLDARP